MATKKRTSYRDGQTIDGPVTDVHGQTWTPAKFDALLGDLYGRRRRGGGQRRDRRGRFKNRSPLARLRRR